MIHVFRKTIKKPVRLSVIFPFTSALASTPASFSRGAHQHLQLTLTSWQVPCSSCQSPSTSTPLVSHLFILHRHNCSLGRLRQSFCSCRFRPYSFEHAAHSPSVTEPRLTEPAHDHSQSSFNMTPLSTSASLVPNRSYTLPPSGRPSSDSD